NQRSSLSVWTGTGGNTMDVKSTGTPLALTAVGGVNTMNVMNTGAPLTITTLGGVNTMNVMGTGALATLITGGQDAINIGKNSSVQNVKGKVSIEGNSGSV